MSDGLVYAKGMQMNEKGSGRSRAVHHSCVGTITLKTLRKLGTGEAIGNATAGVASESYLKCFLVI